MIGAQEPDTTQPQWHAEIGRTPEQQQHRWFYSFTGVPQVSVRKTQHLRALQLYDTVQYRPQQVFFCVCLSVHLSLCFSFLHTHPEHWRSKSQQIMDGMGCLPENVRRKWIRWWLLCTAEHGNHPEQKLHCHRFLCPQPVPIYGLRQRGSVVLEHVVMSAGGVNRYRSGNLPTNTSPHSYNQARVDEGSHAEHPAEQPHFEGVLLPHEESTHRSSAFQRANLGMSEM